MSHRYPQPGNEDAFEEFCVRLYRSWLKRSGLVRYAKRGEEQHGIDIVDQLSMEPRIAIQCKHREPNKTLAPKEIRGEVAHVESSCQPVDHYIIATTAKKSRNAQDAVRKLNERPSASRRFTIEIHFWEEICTYLSECGKVVADFIVWGERDLKELLEFVQSAVSSAVSGMVGSTNEPESGEMYPEIRALMNDRKLEAAEHEIGKLPDPESDATLGKRQRYGILRVKAADCLRAGAVRRSGPPFPTRLRDVSGPSTGSSEPRFCV